MFAALESSEYDGVAVHLRASFDLSRLEGSVAVIHECDLARSGMKHARFRNHQLAAHRHIDPGVHKHSKREFEIAIWDLQAHLSRARFLIQLRPDETDAPPALPPRIGIDGGHRGSADSNT